MAIGRPISLTPNIATKNISSLATADQTEFTVTGGYRINEIAVYRNGVRLAEGRDFTASDGDTVNLVTAATASDVIEFAVFDSFNVSDAIVSAASSQNLNGDFNVTGSLYAGTFEPGQLVAGIATASTALHVGSALTANAAGDVETIGIITAGSFSGDGSALTGLANTDYIVSVATTTGDLKVGAAVTVGGIVNIDATTDSTSSTTGALIVDGGLGVAKNVYIGAGLSVAGTLTYEDVTNVDSVGVVTAKSGVNITGGQLTIGTGITMGIAGVATFSGTGDVHLHDNVRLNVGDASDLSIYHDGSNTYIDESGTGQLTIRASKTSIQKYTGEICGTFTADGAADLYYDNSKKFETTGSGTTTTGIGTFSGGIHVPNGNATSDNIALGNGSELQLWHNGTYSAIQADTFKVVDKSNGHGMITADADGAVGLRYDNSQKFETTNDGVVITGICTDSLGNVRDIPLRSVTGSAATLVLTDAGKVVSTNTTGWTVPALSWVAGNTVTLLNNSAGGLVITCSAVTTYLTSDGTTVTSKTLGARGMATLYFVSSSVAYLQGTALS